MKRLTAVTLVGAATMLFAASAEGGALRFLQTPDRNIGCALFKAGKRSHGNVRCDINDHTWVPPAGKQCAAGFGDGVELRERGRGHYNCPHDSVVGLGPVLQPGASASKDRFTCTVTQAGPTAFGVSCINRRNRHGFDLTPSTVNLY